jgi:enolase
VKYLNQVPFAGRSSAPSGASTGSNEARELRDTGSPRYLGKGTATVAANVTIKLSPALAGLKLCCIKALEAKIQEVDGTPLKENIGSNATRATSFVLAEAGASLEHIQRFQYFAKNYFSCENVPPKFKLPSPLFNVFNGGKYAGSNLKFQEFMVTPTRALSYPDQLRIIAEVYQKLGGILVKKYGVSAKNLGDQGGFAPPLNTHEEALVIINEGIVAAGYAPGTQINIALDEAASEFHIKDRQVYEVEVGMFKTGDKMVDYYEALVKRHSAITPLLGAGEHSPTRKNRTLPSMFAPVTL